MAIDWPSYFIGAGSVLALFVAVFISAVWPRNDDRGCDADGP